MGIDAGVESRRLIDHLAKRPIGVDPMDGDAARIVEGGQHELPGPVHAVVDRARRQSFSFAVRRKPACCGIECERIQAVDIAFGRIAAALRKAGTPIPTNDIWIAAHVFETGAELITFDRHFDSVRGLPLTTLPTP